MRGRKDYMYVPAGWNDYIGLGKGGGRAFVCRN